MSSINVAMRFQAGFARCGAHQNSPANCCSYLFGCLNAYAYSLWISLSPPMKILTHSFGVVSRPLSIRFEHFVSIQDVKTLVTNFLLSLGTGFTDVRFEAELLDRLLDATRRTLTHRGTSFSSVMLDSSLVDAGLEFLQYSRGA